MCRFHTPDGSLSPTRLPPARIDISNGLATIRLHALHRRLSRLAGSLTLLLLGSTPGFAEVNKVDTVAPDVYFHEGDLGRRAHCNNGWIVFQDYVLVVDANFPSGAKEVIPKIRAITDKPIRFVFDTHHHGDHAYGNQIWADNGAVVVAHEGVLAEMKRYETGRYGDKPGRWEDAAKGREDVSRQSVEGAQLAVSQGSGVR
jgi:cyclase